MCFKCGPVSTCLSGSEPVVYRASPPPHFYHDLFPLKSLTDHKIILSSQTTFLVCCEGAAPSLSLLEDHSIVHHLARGAPMWERIVRQEGLHMADVAGQGLVVLNCPDVASNLFKKRKRERKKTSLEKPEENFLPIVVFCKHWSFLLPSSSTPSEAGDENGSFVPFPGAQLQQKCSSVNSTARRGWEGPSCHRVR